MIENHLTALALLMHALKLDECCETQRAQMVEVHDQLGKSDWTVNQV